jgi:hypothetical protein
MGSKSQLIEVKKALADKYARLAKVAKSRPKQKKFLHMAQAHRRQAERLLQH